jgi:hypothetical protein
MLPYLQASDDRLLPLITYNQILLGVTVMVCLKITVKQIFKNVILESVRNKRFQKELDTQYYYHLGMVLVLVATVHILLFRPAGMLMTSIYGSHHTWLSEYFEMHLMTSFNLKTLSFRPMASIIKSNKC